jgi:hypothetical protein
MEMDKRTNEIVDRLFVILHDYAGLGSAANKATVLELQQLLFKVFLLARNLLILCEL